MMDFNLILLLVGVGLLGLVVIFALLGFFAGLKKELKCTAIAFVLILLALLVYGEPSTLLNSNIGIVKGFLTDVPATAETVWDYVVYLAQTNVPGGAEIFVEGSKSYAFLYDVVGGIARGAMLLVGTLLIFIIVLITNGIFRLVTRIVACSKAKKKAKSGEPEAQPEPDKNVPDNVLVAKNEEGDSEGVVISTNKTPESNKKSKHRGWAALLAAARCVVVILFLFAPISGICTVLDNISPKTEELINDVLTRESTQTANSDTALDMALDFKDSYYDSAIGKFVEASSFFFGESISTKLFDGAFKIETETDNIKLRQEILVVLDAVNALEGNVKIDALKKAELNGALDALKDSKLIVAAMPVALEVLYYLPLDEANTSLSDYLIASGQQAAYLSLRNADWDKNIEVLLDTVKEAYKLGFLNDDFNVLTMDEAVLRDVVNTLSQSDVVCALLNIAIPTALNLQQIVDVIGKLPKNPDLSNMDWNQELNVLVDIYAKFQELEITSLENIDLNQLISDILNDDEQFDITAEMLAKVFKLQLIKDVALDVAFNYVANIENVKDAGYKVTKAVKELADLDWEGDVVKYLEAVKIALPMLDFSKGLVPNVDYYHLDVEILNKVVNKLFETESLEKVLPIAANIALALPAVKELTGEHKVVIDTSKIDWKKDFTTLVSIYEEALKLGVDNINDVTSDVLAFASKTLDSEEKTLAVSNVLNKLASLDLFANVVVPFGNSYAKKLLTDKEFDPSFIELLDLTTLTVEQWQSDFAEIVKVAVNVNKLCGFNFNLKSIDFSEAGIAEVKLALTSLLNLNLLKDDAFKNALVKQVLTLTKVFDAEAIEEMNFDNVAWLQGEGNEHDNLQALLDCVVPFAALDGVDLNNLSFDFNKLLSNKEFVDCVLSVLEVVAESNLILEAIPATVDKFLIPQLEKFDDEDGTLNDIINGLESKELVEEVQKLVVALKSAIDLGVFDIATEGLNGLNLEQTNAMRNIVNAIFDSKLLEGYEARVIRLALKLTKIFPDLEKGAFEGIDFDREQQILLSFIDDLEVVLQDPAFLVFKDGVFQLYKDFYTKEETLNAFLNGLDTLFGKYTKAEETSGSAIIERLLPLMVEKYVLPAVPENLKDLVAIFDLEEPNQAALASDLRRLIYILNIAVEMEVQAYIAEGDFEFTKAFESVSEIIEVFFNLQHIKGNESEAVAWALNYVVSSAKLDIDKFVATDFEAVDWDLEVENIQGIISTLFDIVNKNDISTVNKLTSFIKDKGYLKESFLNNDNAELAIVLLEKVVNLQIIEQILPVALEYGLKLAQDKNFDVSFLGENMTAELLAEDLISLIDALRIAVFELDLLDYYHAKWTGDLPEIEPVLEILDIVFNLNLIEGRENQLLQTVVEKFLPANDFVKVSDLDFSFALEFDSEWAIIKDAIRVLYSALPLNNLTKIEDVKAFISEKQYMPFDGLLSNENLLLVADLLDVLSESKLVQDALIAAIRNGIEVDAIAKYGDFSILKNLSKPELANDVKTLANIIREAVELDVVTLYFEKDIVIDYDQVATILDLVAELNIVNKCAYAIIPEVLNSVLGANEKIEINHEFNKNEFMGIDFKEEFALLGDVLIELGELLNSINLDSVQDILQFVKNKDFTNEVVLTTENVNMLLDAVDLLVESQLLEAVSVGALDIAINLAVSKNFDISFLNGLLTNEELGSDFGVIAEILHNAVDFGAVEYLVNQDIDPLEIDYVVNVVALLDELNILAKASPEWTALVAGILVDKLQIDISILASTYENVDYSNENLILQNLVREIGELLGNENLESIKEIKDYISKEYFKDINAFNDAAINNVQNILRIASQSEVLKVNLVSLVEFGAKVLGQKLNMDLSFVDNKFTGEELAADLNTLADISEFAVEFGIVDLIFTKDVELNDLDPVVNIVALLEELNIAVKCNKEISALVFNKLLPMLKIDETADASEFADVDYAAENLLLQQVVREVETLLKAENVSSYQELLEFINNKEYTKKETYNNAAINTIQNILRIASQSEIVKVKLVTLFEFGLDKLSEKSGLDLSFAYGRFTRNDLAEDINTLVEISEYLVEFGLVEIIFDKDLDAINLELIIDAIPLLEELNLAVQCNKNIAALVFNKVLPMLKINETVVATDFNDVDFANENVVLQNALRAVAALLDDFNLVSFSDVKEFASSKAFMKSENYNDNVYAHLLDLTDALLDSQIVTFALPIALNYAVDKLAEQNLDLTYLKDALTGEEIASDLRIILDEAIWWLDSGDILEAIETKAIKPNHIDDLANTLNKLDETNLYNVDPLKFAVNVTNFVAVAIKYDGRIDESYFEGISNWQAENEKTYVVLREINDIVETFGVEHDILSLENLKAFAKEGLKNKEIYTNELLTSIEEVLRAASEAKVVVSELVFAHEYLASSLAAKDIYIDYTIVEAKLLAEDLDTLADLVEAVVAADVLEYAIHKGELNQRYVEKFADALVDVIDMNTLSADGAKERLLALALRKLGVDVIYQDLYKVDWNAEKLVIKDMILSANEALRTFELNTLDSFKSFKDRAKDYLKVTDETNKQLYVIADVLEALGSSELVEKLVLPLSEKYLANENLAGYADLHNLYLSGSQVTGDLNKLVSVINGVIDLDLDSFLNHDELIPYGNTDAVNSIIRGLFGLDYLNNDGNLTNLLSKLTKTDLSSIDDSKIDLVGDAELLVDMYDSLLTVLLDDEFFLKDRNDLRYMFVEVRYWSQEKYVEALKVAINNLLSTTIVKETNGAIFLLLVPVLKKAAPDIYEALDPERLTINELKEDGDAIISIVDDILAADLSSILGGSYFTEEVEELLTSAIDKVSNLNLLAGRGSALANCIANRLDCKKIGNIEFYASDYDFDSVNYYADAQTINAIIHEVFNFLRDQNIVTNSDLVNYMNILKVSLKEELSNPATMESLEKVLGYVTELTFVEHNGLLLYNLFGKEALTKATNETLADLDSVYASSTYALASSSNEFHADLVRLHQILVKLNDGGLPEVLGGGNINYNQADLVKEVLNLVAEIKYVNVLLVDIVEFADSKSEKVDLSSIDFAQVDLDADLEILGQIYEQLIPVLLSSNNPFTTLDAIKAGSINKSDLYALIYDYQSIYPSVIELASDITIAPQLVKFAYSKFEGKLNGNVAAIAQILDIESMNDAELREDLVVIADVLRKVETLDVLRYVLYKDDIEVTDNETISALVEDAFKLHMVDNNFEALVKEMINIVVKVDLSSVDFSSMDQEAEQALLVELANDAVVVANSLDVVNLSDVKPYIRNLISSLKSDVKEGINLLKDKQFKAALKQIVNTALDEVRKANGEATVEVVEELCASEIFASVLLPVYEQKVFTKLSGILATIGDIHDYNEDNLRDDLSLVASIARNLFDSGIYRFATDRVLPNKEASVPYLEAAIKDICNLTILDVKKQDLGPVAEELLVRVGLLDEIQKLDKDFDLSNADCESINFSADADLYASMATYGYDVLAGLLDTGFNMGIFGNTEAMKALVEIYTISIETSAMDVIGHKALNAVTKLAAKFKMTVNENDEEVLYNISEFLFGLVELGFFSNDGIDLTKVDVVKAMVDNVYASVTLPNKLQKLIDKVVSRVDAYGVVPFDWNKVSARNEAKVMIDVAKLGLEFVNNHAPSIKEFDLSILADAKAQSELTEIATRLADSSFVEQLFFPFVEGTFKALTMGYTDGEMIYNATLDDVLNISLPNFFRLMNAINDICGFKPSNINKSSLTNFDALREVVEVVCSDIMLKDNVAKLMTTFIGKFSSYDLTAEEIAKLEAVDFEADAKHVINALNILQATYDNNSFELNAEAIKNSAVVNGAADALDAILDSEAFQVLSRKLVSIINNRILTDIDANLSSVVRDRLNDDAYTNDQVNSDLHTLVDVLHNLAASKMYSDEFTAWDYAALENVIKLGFGTYMVQGYEDIFGETLIHKVPQLENYYDESMVIADWENELLTAVKALESLVNDGVTDLSLIDVETLSGHTLDIVCESVILKQLVADKMNEKLEELNLNNYYVVTLADFDSVVSWDNELEAVRKLVDLMELIDKDVALSDYELVSSRYEYISNNTIFINRVVVSCGSYIVTKMPVVKEYVSFVNTDSWTFADWDQELDAIVTTIKEMKNDSQATMENPIEELNAKIINSALNSEILTAGFVHEFNMNLVALGLDYKVYQASDFTSVKDWDLELNYIQQTKDLMDEIDAAGTLTPALAAQITALVAEVNNNSAIAKEILAAGLEARGH